MGYYIPIKIPIFGLVFDGIRIFIVASMVFAILTIWQDSNLTITYTDIGIIVTWLFLISSVVWSYAPEATARTGTDLLFYIVFFLTVIVYFKRDPSLRIIFSSILSASIILIALGLIDHFETSLLKGVFGVSRNIYARNIAGLFPMFAIYSYYSNSWNRFIYIILSILAIILVALTGSRSGFVAIIFSLIILAILFFATRETLTRKRMLPFLLVSFVGMSMFFYLGLEYQILPTRLTKIPLSTDAFSPSVLGENRYLVYLAEGAAIQKYWLTGMGFGAFEVWSSAEFGIPRHQAHDLITRIWLGSGIGAVMIFLITYGLIIRNYIGTIVSAERYRIPYLLAALLGLLSISLTGMANIVYIEPLFYIWLAVGSHGILSLASNSHYS